MNILRFMAFVFGALFMAMGALGYLPAAMHEQSLFNYPDLVYDKGYGLLFGLFPVNAVENSFHLALGLWGVLAYNSVGASRFYFRSISFICALLALMGLLPFLDTTFGYVPVFGHDVWLHTAIAVVASYFGFGAHAVGYVPGTKFRHRI